MFLVADEALIRESPSWSAEFDELVDLEGDGSWCGHAQGDLYVVVERERIRISGTVRGTVPRECDLCLGHYLEPVETDVAEVCVVGGEAETAVFDEDAEVWRVAPEGRLSLTELVRQALLLALPTRALCGETCPGRRKLNVDRTAGERVDPRLAVLREILEPEDKDDGRPEATNE